MLHRECFVLHPMFSGLRQKRIGIGRIQRVPRGGNHSLTSSAVLVERNDTGEELAHSKHWHIESTTHTYSQDYHNRGCREVLRRTKRTRGKRGNHRGGHLFLLRVNMHLSFNLRSVCKAKVRTTTMQPRGFRSQGGGGLYSLI